MVEAPGQLPGRDAGQLFARSIGSIEKDIGQITSQVGRHNACSHYEAIHAVVLDPVTRTAKVRFSFDNPGSALLPEMYGTVRSSVWLRL